MVTWQRKQKRKTDLFRMTPDVLEELKSITPAEYREMLRVHEAVRREIGVLTSLNAHLHRRIKAVVKIHESYRDLPVGDKPAAV